MKKTNLLLIALIVGTTFSSCKKDDETEVNPVTTPDKFSELSVEENKANLEDNGIQLVNEMNDLKNTSAIKTTISLSHFLDMNDPLADDGIEGGRTQASSSKYALVRAISQFGQGKSGSNAVFGAMKTTVDEDPQTAQEAFDDLKGTYSWNTSTSDWDVTEGGENISFKFPSTEDGTSNNAVYTIHSYTGITTASNPFGEEYTGDFPTGLAVNLTVNGDVVLEYGFTAGYNNSGEPTSFETYLTLTPFKYSVTLTNNTQEASVKYSLTNDGSILLDMGIGAKGNFTTEVIENSENGGDVLSSGYAYFQLLDVKLAGEVNAKALIEDDDKIYEEYEGDEAVEKFVASLNENVNLTLFYVEANVKIADSEFYASEAVDQQCTWELDLDIDEYVYVCNDVTYLAENIRLVFADDSKMDIETYTEGSFADLETDFEELLDAIEADLD